MFPTAHPQGFGNTDPVFPSSVALENSLENIVSWNSFPGIHPKLALFLIVPHYFFPLSLSPDPLLHRCQLLQ